MTINANEYKSAVGLDQLYFSKITVDDAGDYSAAAPAYLAPAAEASQEPTSSFDIQYADDQAYDVSTSEGETKISLTVTGIPLEVLAEITGRVFDAATGRMFDNAGVAPYCALSFRSLKSNGSYRYYQYLKGKFDMPKEESVTKAEKAEPKTVQLTFTAIKTVHKFTLSDSVTDSVKRIVGDEDTAGFDGDTWFTQVQIPGVSTPSALALSSSVPVDDATGISKSASLTLTYNNAIDSKSITLLNNSMAVVACTVSADSAQKVITINPDSDLSGLEAHTLVASVTDIYGQALTSVVTFTTAS